MEMPRLSKSIRKVVQLQRDKDGAVVPTVLFKGNAKKRKISSAFKPLEKGIRRMAESHASAMNSYLDRHERSNEKRKDGFVKDFAANVVRAGRKGTKKLSKGWRAPSPIKMY